MTRNRVTTEAGIRTAYTANKLNQYTAEGSFKPTSDADGNQTLIKTSTGIWSVSYNAKNRPVLFTKSDGSVTVECTYDTMGRRATKKVTTNGSVTEHRRFLYRGYLQIACCDLTRAYTPALWFILWDPTQPTATRPLAIQKNGTWYTYGWDLTKNICETYRTDGRIDLAYTYTPYGEVSPAHAYDQPLRWSSEYHDVELGLVYYNYRHYNPMMGRWMGRDILPEFISKNIYILDKVPTTYSDHLGMFSIRVETEGCGHVGIDVAGESWNFGRYLGRYNFKKKCPKSSIGNQEIETGDIVNEMFQAGPMILMKGSAKDIEIKYTYKASPELEEIMSKKLKKLFEEGISIENMPSDIKELIIGNGKYFPNKDYREYKYLNESWSYTNNCTSKVTTIILDTAIEATHSSDANIRKEGFMLEFVAYSLIGIPCPWFLKFYLDHNDASSLFKVN